MQKKRRSKPKTQSGGDIKTTAIKALTGSAVSLILFFALTALMSLILWKKDSDTEIFKYVMLAVGAVSGFIGGFAAVRPTRKNGIAVGALSALPPYFIIILVSALIAENGVSLIGWLLLGVMILFSAVGGIIAVNKRK